MASHIRTMRPGEAQARRGRFCVRVFLMTLGLAVLLAIVIGMPFPGFWRTVFAPTFTAVSLVEIVFISGFFCRAAYLKGLAKHHATMMKLRNDPDFR